MTATGMVITDEDKCAMIDAIMAGEISYGKYNAMTEKALAKYEGKRTALLVNSGSSANLLALMAYTSPDMPDARRLKPGDEVITLAASFPTTVSPIIQARAVPVFVDINETYNIDVSQLQRALSPKTKGVMIAHTLGIPFDIDVVQDFCTANGLFFIADCCDALGSIYKGQTVTSRGDVVTNSFYPAHHITAGEGGAVLTDDPLLADIIQSMRDWGRACKCDPGKDNKCGARYDGQWGDLPEGYDHKYVYRNLGYNLKMTNPQAALLGSQLKRVDEYGERRKSNFNTLYDSLGEWTFPHFLNDGSWVDYSSDIFAFSEPSWFGYPICLPLRVSRPKVLRKLSEAGIGTRLFFAGNILKQPLPDYPMRQVGKELHITDNVMEQAFWIGCWHGLTMKDIIYERDTVRALIQQELK